nr:retrovirus-related Pol polyprotein from transposon TNT 1-94 [Tanacetum cinerariifolium]
MSRDVTRKTVLVETPNSSTLVSCDWLGGYDWSDQAKEGPTNYALMAYSTPSASSLDSKIIECQIVDNCKKGLGYNAVPPPHTGLFPPPKSNLSSTGLEELFNEPKTKKSKDKSNEVEPKSVRKHSDAPIIKDWVSDDEEEEVEKQEVKPSINRINFVKATADNNPKETVKTGEQPKQNTHRKRVWNNSQRVNHKNHSNAKRNHVSQAAPTVNAARPFNVVHPKRTMNAVNQELCFSKQPHSFVQRPNKKLTALKNSYANKKVKTVWVKKVNTAKPKATVNAAKEKAKYNAVKGKRGNVVKASACWANPQEHLQDKEVIDSGCSRHMIGNMSFLTYYKEINEGYVAFGVNPKRGKITGKGKIKTGKLDFENVYFVTELKFNLFSVSQICEKNSVLFTDTEGTKDETSGTLKSFIYKVENLMNLRVKIIRCDNGTEFKNREMNQFCEVKGKFDGKADKSFFVGYSLNSKAFRVFSSGTRIMEENLHRDDEDLRKENECNAQREEDSTNNTNRVNTVTSNINSASSSEVNAIGTNIIIDLPPDLNMPSLEDIGVFEDSHDDEDAFGAETDFHNLDFTFQEELLQFKLQNVWILVDLPQGKRAIGSKWVFRNKMDERRIIIRNKARLVAQGNTQEEGIDYDKVFAPVARIEAIRLFLAYALFKDFIVYQIDLKSAFLYGKIEGEVYVCQPHGFEDPDFPDKVYKVEKALYALHQAPRAWYETLFIFLLENRFKRGQIDKTLFIKTNKDVKKASTPMETSKPLLNDEDGEEVDVHMYRSMIGSLMYLTSSRPDIMFDIVDFLNANQIKYALMVSPTIYTAYIKQFCTTLKIKTVNDDVRLQALIDGKKVVITKASIRHDLKLNDAEGTSYLLNAIIFEELARIGAKTTSWNEFSNTMASAIICLANNQKFNFPKYILGNLKKNLEAGVPFYMFSRFIQVFVNHHIGDMSHHKGIYVNPSLIKKVFANMKRVGTRFFGVVTPLFGTMMRKHKPRRKERKEIEVSPTELHIEDHVPTTSNELLPSGEDRMQLKELMVLCINLSNKVLDLENEVIEMKSSHKAKIAKLESKVEKLEEENRSSTKELKSFITRVESSAIKENVMDKEESSKQGRKIADIDADVEVNLENMYNLGMAHEETVLSMQDVTDADVKEVAEEMVEVITTAKIIVDEVSTACGELNTANEEPVSAAPSNITTAQPSEATKATVDITTAPKAKGIVFHDMEEPTTRTASSKSQVKDKDKAKIEAEWNADMKDNIDWNEEGPEMDVERTIAPRKRTRKEKVEKDQTVKKQKGDELKQDNTEKQKLEEQQEDEELKRNLEIVHDDEDDVFVNVTPSSSKPPIIVDYKIYKEGKKEHF